MIVMGLNMSIMRRRCTASMSFIQRLVALGIIALVATSDAAPLLPPDKWYLPSLPYLPLSQQ